MEPNQTFEEQLAQAYGLKNVAELYFRVTGLPIWADQVGREYRAAKRKWETFLAECRTVISKSI